MMKYLAKKSNARCKEFAHSIIINVMVTQYIHKFIQYDFTANLVKKVSVHTSVERSPQVVCQVTSWLHDIFKMAEYILDRPYISILKQKKNKDLFIFLYMFAVLLPAKCCELRILKRENVSPTKMNIYDIKRCFKDMVTRCRWYSFTSVEVVPYIPRKVSHDRQFILIKEKTNFCRFLQMILETFNQVTCFNFMFTNINLNR